MSIGCRPLEELRRRSGPEDSTTVTLEKLIARMAAWLARILS
jgi:hypothetical protein